MFGNKFITYIHHATRLPIKGGICVLTAQVIAGEISSGQCGYILLAPTQSQQVTIQSIGIIDPYEPLRDSILQTLPLTIDSLPGNPPIERFAGHFCVENPTGVHEIALETVVELNKRIGQGTSLQNVKGISGKIELNHQSYPGVFLLDGEQKHEKQYHGILKLLVEPQIAFEPGDFFQITREGKNIGGGVIQAPKQLTASEFASLPPEEAAVEPDVTPNMKPEADSPILTGLSDAELDMRTQMMLPDAQQDRLDQLLQKNRAGKLSAEEEQELDQLFAEVQRISVIKAKAIYTLQQRSNRKDETPSTHPELAEN